MSSESTSFGQMLARLRLSRTVPMPVQHGNWSGRLADVPMSQNELARRAGLTAGEVWRLEQGELARPRRSTVTALAEALNLSPIDRDRLLISVGYWPWPGQAEDVERALAAVHGDFYEALMRTG